MKKYLIDMVSKKKAASQFALRGISLRKTCAVQSVGWEKWRAVSADPYFLMAMKTTNVDTVTIRFSLAAEKQHNCFLYYGYEKDSGSVFPENRVLLEPEKCKEGMTIDFKFPVSMIRLDPIEQAGEFCLRDVEISAGGQMGSNRQKAGKDFYVCSIEQGLSRLNQKVKTGELNVERTILLITHEMTKTGAPQLCAGLEEVFAEKGYDILILCIRRSRELYEKFERNAEWIFFAQTLKEQEEVLQGLSKLGITKALSNTVASGCCAGSLHKHHFLNLVLIHEMEISCRINALPQDLKAIAEFSEHIVFPAQIVQKDFVRLLKGEPIRGECKIFPQGLYKKAEEELSKSQCARKIKKKYGIPQGAKVVLSAGVKGPVKGTDLIPLIAGELKDPNIHFLWLGSCQDSLFECVLQNMVQKLGMEENLHFEEYILDQGEYLELMTGADLFLLPSREDSYPSVLLEAMACGTVTAAFENSGGAQELLNDGKGILVPFLDLRQMAIKIQDVLQFPEKYSDMRQKAKDEIKRKADFSAYAQALLEILMEKEKI